MRLDADYPELMLDFDEPMDFIQLTENRSNRMKL
jgi:hypothetical protein